MTDEYVLWSCRLGGWLTRSAQYTTDYGEAERFPHVKALDRCKLQRGNMAQFGLIPVAVKDLEVMK